jgi:hypothetical protein
LYAVHFAQTSLSMAGCIIDTRVPRMTVINTEIPAGFERQSRRSPLTDPWEPIYSKHA